MIQFKFIKTFDYLKYPLVILKIKIYKWSYFLITLRNFNLTNAHIDNRIQKLPDNCKKLAVSNLWFIEFLIKEHMDQKFITT